MGVDQAGGGDQAFGIDEFGTFRTRKICSGLEEPAAVYEDITSAFPAGGGVDEVCVFDEKHGDLLKND